MKFKLLASSVLMAGALMGSGTASAFTDWSWTGSLDDWSKDSPIGGLGGTGILDSNPPQPIYGTSSAPVSGDGDTKFTFLNYDGGLSLTGTAVTLTEEEIGGRDIYNVGFSWVASQHSGMIGYSVTSDEINKVALDSVISVSGDVSKYIYSSEAAYATARDLYLSDVAGSVSITNGLYSSGALLTQNSLNGSHDPVGGGFTTIPQNSTIWVLDVINSGSTGTGTTGVNIKDIHNEYTVTVPEPTTMIMLGLGLAAFGYSRRNAMAKGLAA